MQPLDTLLLRRLHRHRPDRPAARGFEQTGGIGAIGLGAMHVRAHAVRRQQIDAMTGACKASRPVVGRATRFHHHAQRRTVVERTRERVATEPATFHDARIGIGERKFKHILGKIDGDRGNGRRVGRSMHGGLLS